MSAPTVRDDPSAAIGDFVVLVDSRSMLPIERRTANEFVDFVSQSIKQQLKLQDLSSMGTILPNTSYIAVGHYAAEKLGVSVTKNLSGLGPDGIVISASLCPPHVIVSGGVESSSEADSSVVAERGTMYALYKFLALLGFRWYSHDCSKIPSLDASTPLSSLLVAKESDWPINLKHIPPFRSRDLGYHCAYLSSDWARRNYVNGASAGPRVPAQEKAYDRFTVPNADSDVYGGHLRFSRWPGFEHTLPTMVPAATYFDSHPEWWGMDASGKRSVDLQMCFSNTELQEFVAKQVELGIDLDAAYGPQGLDARNALPDAVAVVQGDGNGFCQCGPCTTIYKDEGTARNCSPVRSLGVEPQQCPNHIPYSILQVTLYLAQLCDSSME